VDDLLVERLGREVPVDPPQAWFWRPKTLAAAAASFTAGETTSR
jgi:hypothetical protein